MVVAIPDEGGEDVAGPRDVFERFHEPLPRHVRSYARPNRGDLVLVGGLEAVVDSATPNGKCAVVTMDGARESFEIRHVVRLGRKASVPYRAGARVDWSSDGVDRSGVVRGVDLPYVTVRPDGGGPDEKLPFVAFSYDGPPADEAWSLESPKRDRSSPTAYEVRVKFAGRTALVARREGPGDPFEYRGGAAKLFAKLEAEAAGWAAGAGFADVDRPVDAWMDWHLIGRPNGRSAADFLSSLCNSQSAPRGP